VTRWILLRQILTDGTVGPPGAAPPRGLLYSEHTPRGILPSPKRGLAAEPGVEGGLEDSVCKYFEPNITAKSRACLSFFLRDAGLSAVKARLRAGTVRGRVTQDRGRPNPKSVRSNVQAVCPPEGVREKGRFVKQDGTDGHRVL